MDHIETLHRKALEHTRGYIAAVASGQWHDPTPCEGWDVRGLVNHITTGNWWAAELGSGKSIAEVGDRLDGDVLGADPLDAYDASAKAGASVFEEPGALERPCAVSYGPVPGLVYLGHRFVDVLIHGWDLAIATDQDATLPAELVAGAQTVIGPQVEMLRASGEFGGDVTPSTADPQTVLLALLGRSKS